MACFQPEPAWTGHGRGRVLIEAAEWHNRQTLSSVLADRGYETSTCPGPEGADGRCPLAAGDGCRAAREADVVIHALRAGDIRNREALRSLRRSDPTTPVIVEVPEPIRSRHAETYDGTVTISPPMDAAALVGAVADAMNDLSTRPEEE